MGWWSGLGSAVTGALSRGLDLVLSRFVRTPGNLSGVQLEIQRRVPDIRDPGTLALVNHVSQAADAASAMKEQPEKPLEDLEQIPVNPFLADRVEPGDRFIYTADVGSVIGEATPDKYFRVDIASSIPMSLAELTELGAEEVERRKEKSPNVQIVGLPDAPGDLGTFVVDFDLTGVVRLY